MKDNNKSNPLWQLLEQGQSIWLDSIQRGQIKSGELKRLMTDAALRGETANPSILKRRSAAARITTTRFANW